MRFRKKDSEGQNEVWMIGVLVDSKPNKADGITIR